MDKEECRNLKNYLLYLKVIQEKLDKLFENQREYIVCKEGCAYCCKNAEFPYTKVEFDFLTEGFLKLDRSLQEEIVKKIQKIIKDKNEQKDKNPNKPFMYDCPLLINNSCCLYNHRGLICRSFGLMSFGDDNKTKIPFCHSKGLNYSSVYDEKAGTLSEEKYKQSGNREVPKIFNMSYKNLTDKDFEKGFDFEFGETKALVDWFKRF